MVDTECQRCQRDISKPALVRCQDGACPLKEKPGRTRSGTVIGMLGAGVVVLAVTVTWMASGASPSKPLPARDPDRIATPRPTHPVATGSTQSWQDWLWKADKPVIADSAATLQHDDRPDPRAASRVQSFACDSNISVGRKLICTHWSLAITDYNVALLYNNALSRSADPRALSRARRAWLAKLDKQGVDSVSILALYDAWRTELTRQAG